MTRFLLLVLSIVLICGAAVGCQTQNSNEDMSSTNLSTDSTSALTQDTEESTSETTGLAGTETTEDVDITEDETTAPPEMMDKEDSPYYGKIAVAYGDSITYGIYHKLGQNSAFYANPKWCDVVSNELGFFADKEQQDIVRRSGVKLSIGFDGHNIEDYLPDRVRSFCATLERLELPMAFSESRI